MRIGFFVNDIQTEKAEYTTTCLAMAALERGHEAWYIGVEDFAYDPDDHVRARARKMEGDGYNSNEAFVEALQDDTCEAERIDVANLDVLLLRNNPADDAVQRPWAQSVGIIFGQIAVRMGVIVLNDPGSLANAFNKLYFQFFPEEVRPKTLITRDREEVRAFVDEQEGKAILKPLQGSGGENVFLVQPDMTTNLNQIVEAISRDGYVVAQEYLPAASDGDLRLFLMNGKPLQHEGKYAIFRRVHAEEDIRSNIHAGGHAEDAEVDDAVLHIAEVVRPKLVQDGMFLVGLDIAGDKLMEINVFSPGGLYSMQQFKGVHFADVVIAALEEKVEHLRRYGKVFGNTQVAMI